MKSPDMSPDFQTALRMDPDAVEVEDIEESLDACDDDSDPENCTITFRDGVDTVGLQGWEVFELEEAGHPAFRRAWDSYVQAGHDVAAEAAAERRYLCGGG